MSEIRSVEESRRQLLKGMGLGGLSAGLLAACGGASSNKNNGGNGAVGNFPKTPKFKFVFVNHVTSNPFFQPTQYGIQDACAITNTSYQWTGSDNSIVKDMVTAMNTAIDANVDGIAVALIDPHAFNGPTERALKKGIPVVSYNADETSNARLAYIGQDLYLSGQEMGKRIVDLVGSGKVGIFIATPGTANIQPRFDGAKDAIKSSGANIELKEVATGAQTNAEQPVIDSWWTGNQDAKGMFAVDAGSTQGVSNVMTKYGLQKKGIHGGGYDLLTPTLQAIKAGVLDFTIDQDAYLQGFLPVLYLYLYKLSGKLLAPPNTNTGLTFVTKDIVDPYISVKSRYEGSTSDQKYVK